MKELIKLVSSNYLLKVNKFSRDSLKEDLNISEIDSYNMYNQFLHFLRTFIPMIGSNGSNCIYGVPYLGCKITVHDINGENYITLDGNMKNLNKLILDSI